MKAGFIPISLEKYINLHLKNDPGTTRKEITDGLKRALRAYKKGAKCACGNSIWVIGSALTSNACSPVLLVRHILMMIMK